MLARDPTEDLDPVGLGCPLGVGDMRVEPASEVFCGEEADLGLLLLCTVVAAVVATEGCCCEATVAEGCVVAAGGDTVVAVVVAGILEVTSRDEDRP